MTGNSFLQILQFFDKVNHSNFMRKEKNNFNFHMYIKINEVIKF